MSNGRLFKFVTALAVFVAPALSAFGHVFVPRGFRLGAFPKFEGSGWEGEAYLNIPDIDGQNLLTAEVWAEAQAPDFTFRTNWIDYPAGPVNRMHDADYETIGDFLNDYIYEVSDPSKLDEPFGNFIIKFTGYIAVAMEHDTFPGTGLPVWVDFRSLGQDGYRLFVGMSIYRFPLIPTADFFWQEQPILEATGMYRAEYTYFNRYDPFGSYHTEYAGIEMYTWHGGGLELPGGAEMINTHFPELGPGTVINPTIIYREEDVAPLPPGDFDADTDIDAQDIRWFQACFTGEPEGFILLNTGCEQFDFDKDVDVDQYDYDVFIDLITGP